MKYVMKYDDEIICLRTPSDDHQCSALWPIKLQQSKELRIKKELSRTLKSTIYLATWKGTEVVVKCAGLHSDLAPNED